MSHDNEPGGAWLFATLVTLIVVFCLWVYDYIWPDLVTTVQLWISSLCS